MSTWGACQKVLAYPVQHCSRPHVSRMEPLAFSLEIGEQLTQVFPPLQVAARERRTDRGAGSQEYLAIAKASKEGLRPGETTQLIARRYPGEFFGKFHHVPQFLDRDAHPVDPLGHGLDAGVVHGL